MEAGTLPKRADAVRNRERVVAAAAEVFAERGVEATVPEVAARAGVGKATVYRSFPSKEHLVAAVANDRLTEFERSARERLDAPDAWEALVELFNEAAERYCRDRSLTGALFPGARSDLLAAARADVWRAVGELMDRAKAQGSMRPDATAADVRVLWAGVARMLASDGVDDPAEWRRYAALALGALRACG
jgi:AcrR family transcriptional regulator